MNVSGIFQALERFWSTRGRLTRPMVIGALVLVTLILLALLGYWLRVLDLPAAVWRALGLAMLGLCLLWLILRGIPWYRQYRFLRNQRAALTAKHLTDRAEPRRILERQLLTAKKAFLHSPKLEAGPDTLYRVPWFLLLGDGDSEPQGLLRAAAEISPFPAPEPSPADQPGYWYWWFFRDMIAIETDPRFICDSSDNESRSIWYQALQLLQQNRSKLPLNGIVVMVAAKKLLQDPEQIRAYGLRLRRLIDEAMEFLRLQLPIYIVITRCEQLPGFAGFMDRLPEAAVTNQALGHCVEGPTPTNRPPDALMDELFGKIRQRLHTIRLGLLKGPPDSLTPQDRRSIFQFVEVFAELRPNLTELAKSLFEENPLQRTPQWRGLYFTAGPEQSAFVGDLFTRFLPRDQPLARPTHQSVFNRWLRSLLGTFFVAALSWLVSAQIIDAYREDSLISEQAKEACPENLSTIQDLWQCQKKVAGLEAKNAKRGYIQYIFSRLGFAARGVRDEHRLKTRFIAAFHRLVDQPLERRLAWDMETDRVGLGHYLALVQRLNLLRTCRESGERCGDSASSEDFIFSSPLATALPGARAARADLDEGLTVNQALFQGYLAYLQWQREDFFGKEMARQRQALTRMLRDHPLTPADVVTWASARSAHYPPYTLTQFWKPDAPGASPRLIGINAAYTHRLWDEILAPFVARLQQLSPDDADDIRAFTSAYFDAYFRQWRDFLTEFPQGYKLWQGDAQALIRILAQEKSTYPPLWQAVDTNTFNLSQDSAGKLPPWRDALKYTLENNWRSAQSLLDQFFYTLQRDRNGRTSYNLVSELFSPGGGQGTSEAKDFWKLWQLVENPRQEDKDAMSPEDRAAWAVVQGPVRLLVMLLTQRAGAYLTTQWNEEVIRPISSLPMKRRTAFLFGEHGKLKAFNKKWLRPFISEVDGSAKRIEGMRISFPLSNQFRNFQARANNLLKIWLSIAPFPAGNVSFTRESDSGSRRIENTNTLFELNCDTRSFKASSKPGRAADTAVNVHWSPDRCSDVRLTITLEVKPPEQPPIAMDDESLTQSSAPVGLPPTPEPIDLVKKYTGSDAFVQFIKDFDAGSKRFGRDALVASYLPGQRSRILAELKELGIHTVRVYISVKTSKEMDAFLKGPPKLTIPNQIVEPFVYSSGSYSQDTPSVHPCRLDRGIHAANGLDNSFQSYRC